VGSRLQIFFCYILFVRKLRFGSHNDENTSPAPMECVYGSNLKEHEIGLFEFVEAQFSGYNLGPFGCLP
jgi:hypothetical protein